ncbi:MAG: aspartate aminotransferase family protein [Chloroflexi bacterium]|nr:MAG: aspartate aminotransferase family protein [Chloroflexota bacterium]TMC29475.1 MAG: aspartate aminotransferase family protein [Chloroflexota bacterium]TMC32874.1 MAG: aspartate aminotransferase family protein [Chloroflexota bacterium]
MATVTRERTGLASDAVRELRERFVPRGLSVGTPVVVARAVGSEVWDPEGKRYLDFVAGIGALNLGHQHPDVTAAVREQLERYTHVSAQVVTYEPYVRLAQELDRIYPRGDAALATKSVFANSGAEAVENSMKIARVATGREWIIAFQNSFHGRTYAAMTATGKTKNSRMAFMRTTTPNIAHLPYPYPYRPLAPLEGDDLAELYVRLFEQALDTNLAPEHVAAVIIEPIQGEGGFIVPPARFLKRIAAICRRHDILFIADEIQTGMARTGRMFAIEHSGVTPDLLVTSKSLGAGFPIGAVTGRADLFDALGPGTLGSTFGGHPIACAAAIKTIEVIERDGLAARATAIGATLRRRFEAMAKSQAGIGEVRGVGAMQAIELVQDRTTKKPAPVDAIIKRACERGLLVLRAGLYSNVIRTLVPLTITDAQLEEGLDILEGSIDG